MPYFFKVRWSTVDMVRYTTIVLQRYKSHWLQPLAIASAFSLKTSFL